MANTNPCNTCEHFDPILRGMKETSKGWCIINSEYPYSDSPGQVTPAHARRVSNPADPARPYIVSVGQVKASCQRFQVKKAKLSKAELESRALGGSR